MTDFKKGDLIFINSNQFADAVEQFRGKWTGMATVMAMVTATVMETEAVSYTVRNCQSGEKFGIKHYGIDWEELNQNLTGIIQEIVPEEHPDFDVFKVYCQQEGSVRFFRRHILERSANRQPASPTHLPA